MSGDAAKITAVKPRTMRRVTWAPWHALFFAQIKLHGGDTSLVRHFRMHAYACESRRRPVPAGEAASVSCLTAPAPARPPPRAPPPHSPPQTPKTSST